METMDIITDENCSQMNANHGLANNKVINKLVANNERRILAPIVGNTSRHLKTKSSSNALQPKQWPNNESNVFGVQKGGKVAKTAQMPNKSDFEIFCDNSDSEMNGSNDENDFDLTLDDVKDEMDSCEETDNLLSERTENSLAIEEEVIIEGFSETDIKCNETIEIESEDEELEDASAYEQTSEVLRSFDLTALSRCKEYSHEIHKYLMFYERKQMADPFYISKQPEINAKMRSILVDWLVEVTEEYKLLDQTLFLAVNYIDRFLSLMSISRQSFQLLGTAALFIASKYEEIYPPELSEFVYITDDSYTKQQILNMEKLILKALDFDVSAPTTYYFIDKFSTDLQLESIIKHLAKYLSHLALLESEPFLRYYPSEIAICSIILSAQTLGLRPAVSSHFIDESIAYEKGLKGGDVNAFLAERQTCLECIHRMHAFAHKHPQQAIQAKYASDK
ncbi:unnamed protein product [Medioppia subpectinata]|uniref:Cyclin A n=1 Tax=Medioppia subpectinata TaxID=1979941 RepID=A0A7R9L2Q1_9ACAR|nr:unnamed protein product [Medioppia subpectinata]CAG2113312.1 unnamed protein product [Medioppia subpectinata]